MTWAGSASVTIGANGQTAYVDGISGNSTTTITQGDSVMWFWENAYYYYGTVFHSTTSGTCDGTTLTSNCTPAAVNGQMWNSGLNYYPFTFSQTFNTPGTYTYFCEEHLGAMQGTIIVLPPPKPLGHQAGPERLRILPASPTLTHGTTQNFQAFGGFISGSGKTGGEKDVTTNATWSSSDQTVVSINPATGAAQIGVAGTATVTARVGNVSGRTMVTVQ